MRLLYTLGICLYTFGLHVAALFGHSKARQMVRGRRQSLPAVQCTAQQHTAWFHAASLGEFEQARPVIEAYRQQHPGARIVLTFFSPSGYEVRKNYPLADVVCYMPADTPRTARRFVQAMRPDVAFFVKYDLWYNTLMQLHRCGTRVYLFSAIFRSGQYFFKPWGRWYAGQLKTCFTHLFVQDQPSMQLLQGVGVKQVSVAGDTRFDRVHRIATVAAPDPVAERFAANAAQVVVAGSTWPADEQIIAEVLPSLPKGTKLILAPHVISDEHLHQVDGLFAHSVRYSGVADNAAGMAVEDATVLIVDNMGLLSRLYRYATVAYIGGGFGVGIHNTLEAAAFGAPVVFGPNYHKFREACDLISCGGAFCHSNAASLRTNLVPLLASAQQRTAASEACLAYMATGIGSTAKILATIEA